MPWHGVSISPSFNAATDIYVICPFPHQQGKILPASWASSIPFAWSFGDESMFPSSLMLLQHLQPWWAEQNLGWWFITGRVLSIQMKGCNQQCSLFCIFLLYFASPAGTFLRPVCNPLHPAILWWHALWWCSAVETPLTCTGSERSLVLTECEVLLTCTYAKHLLSWWPLLVLFITQASEQIQTNT